MKLIEAVFFQVAEYIPKRSSLTKHHCGADEAVSEYHKQIGDVANLVLNEYRQVSVITWLFVASRDYSLHNVIIRCITWSFVWSRDYLIYLFAINGAHFDGDVPTITKSQLSILEYYSLLILILFRSSEPQTNPQSQTKFQMKERDHWFTTLTPPANTLPSRLAWINQLFFKDCQKPCNNTV